MARSTTGRNPLTRGVSGYFLHPMADDVCDYRCKQCEQVFLASKRDRYELIRVEFFEDSMDKLEIRKCDCGGILAFWIGKQTAVTKVED